ncbi:MAG: ATP synthase F1 subunit epsilon [Clostridia bacterium]
MATFKLSIVTPEHVFYEDEIEALVFEAPDGEFCVMAGHEPMVATLVPSELRITMAGGEKKWAAASGGFATILPDEMLVMLQTCEWPWEIDIKRAQRDKRAAQEQLRRQRSKQEYTLARNMLARAMVRLRVTSRNQING